eukprot:gnl/Dysnectes_brevis/5747_a8461_292.p1 GENE.gnl/Dysnectes_brevis/5747_a8461_292~~gnl/Dysnectes_brevis/5747_a8461_292.p1  ORF type:complete len:361 (+),score=76.75 gnl/Dysnectes_brevis/5747_a8461_292:24-1106(+)
MQETRKELLSRQLLIWGDDGQRLISNSHVFINGLTPTSLEIARLLALADVGHISFHCQEHTPFPISWLFLQSTATSKHQKFQDMIHRLNKHVEVTHITHPEALSITACASIDWTITALPIPTATPPAHNTTPLWDRLTAPFQCITTLGPHSACTHSSCFPNPPRRPYTYSIPTGEELRKLGLEPEDPTLRAALGLSAPRVHRSLAEAGLCRSHPEAGDTTPCRRMRLLEVAAEAESSLARPLMLHRGGVGPLDGLCSGEEKEVIEACLHQMYVRDQTILGGVAREAGLGELSELDLIYLDRMRGRTFESSPGCDVPVLPTPRSDSPALAAFLGGGVACEVLKGLAMHGPVTLGPISPIPD